MSTKTLILRIAITIIVFFIPAFIFSLPSIEQAKFFGTYENNFIGLEESTVKDVSIWYNRYANCTYYVELNDGQQLKFEKTYYDKAETCKYQKDDKVNVEVYQDNFNNKEYRLVGIK